MLALRRPRISVHHLLHEVRANHARILHHILRNLQRPRQHVLRAIQQLAEQAVEHLVLGGIHASRRDGLHGARVADQAREEVRRAGLHDQAAAGKDEADLGVAVGEADVHGQRHGDADADGGALEGADGGLAAVEDGEGYSAAAGVESQLRSTPLLSLLP